MPPFGAHGRGAANGEDLILKSVTRTRLLAVVAAATVMLVGAPARADVVVHTAIPDWIIDSTDRVTCPSGTTCSLRVQSWTPPSWGCFQETTAGITSSYTMCETYVSGTITATKVPNGPCALTMIRALQVSFISGIDRSIGGTWHQEATFVPKENSSVGTTKYHVVMHGSGPFENQSVGAGSLYGEFDLTFPAPGLLRSCKSAAAGKLIPTLNATQSDFDGSVLHIDADSVQQ